MDSGNGTLILFGVALFGLMMLYFAWRAYEWKLVFWAFAAPFYVAWKLLSLSGFLGSRALLRIGRGRERVRDPESAELIEREAINPTRTPQVQQLSHGYHWTPAGLIKGVHMGIIAESGAAKGQTIINYQVQHQLQYSDEHLIILEVKPNLELSSIVRAYARPEDRIWEYTMQPKDRLSSAIAITDPSKIRDLARALCFEEDSKDPHWNSKAEELIPAIIAARSELRAEAEEAAARFAGGGNGHHDGGLSSTINDARDVAVDRLKLDELRAISPVVSNVADADKEWGYIRSTTTRHLSALADMRVRRVLAGGPDTPQPLFGRYADGGRDIVIVRPDEESAEREARYIVSILDVLIRRAVSAGHAGGPGVKAILDEFASFMDLSKMRRYLDLGRGGKLQISYVLQGRDQLAAVMGETKANSIIASTEIKVVGATSDVELADLIAKLSGQTRVEFRGAREGDEWLGDWRDEHRPNVQPDEILKQGAGEWTIVHRSSVRKVRVPERYWHHTQAALPREHRLHGVVPESEYRVPPLLNPAQNDDDLPDDEPITDEEPPVGDLVDDDLEDAPTEGGSDEWLD